MSDLLLRILDASDGSDYAAGGSRPLALAEGGNPPSEYLMFAAGVNETVKGPLLFDEESAASVMAEYEARGRKRLAGDWEHDSMVPSDQRAPGYKGSPASHWFTLEVRPGPELWAVDVKWTPTAFAQIQAAEYGHTSPVVKFDKATGRIVAVLSSALTNDPATIGQPQLVAATAKVAALSESSPEKPSMKMTDEAAAKLRALIDGEHTDEADMMGKMKACLAENFPAHFGEKKEEDKGAMADTSPAAAAKLSESAGEKERDADKEEEKREMTALSAFVAKMTGKKTLPEQMAALTSIQMQSEEVVALSAQVAERSDAAFNAVLEEARKAKKLTPADLAANSITKRGKYIATLRADKEHGVIALKAFLEPMGAAVNSVDAPVLQSQNVEGSGVVTLTAAEEASIKKNGIDRAAYLKNKAARLGDGDAPKF